MAIIFGRLFDRCVSNTMTDHLAHRCSLCLPRIPPWRVLREIINGFYCHILHQAVIGHTKVYRESNTSPVCTAVYGKESKPFTTLCSSKTHLRRAHPPGSIYNNTSIGTQPSVRWLSCLILMSKVMLDNVDTIHVVTNTVVWDWRKSAVVDGRHFYVISIFGHFLLPGYLDDHNKKRAETNGC